MPTKITGTADPFIVVLVVPQIYKLSIPDHQKQSGWKWVRARDAYEAINGIRVTGGKDQLDPQEIQDRYKLAFLTGGKPLTRVSQDGLISDGRNSNELFVYAVDNDEFIPFGVWRYITQRIEEDNN